MNQVLPLLNYDQATRDEITCALNTGKDVTTHTDAVSIPGGWSGFGYIITDEWKGYPHQLRCDNEPEFISLALAQWAEDHGVRLEFIKLGTPTQNAYVERFNRVINKDSHNSI